MTTFDFYFWMTVGTLLLSYSVYKGIMKALIKKIPPPVMTTSIYKHVIILTVEQGNLTRHTAMFYWPEIGLDFTGFGENITHYDLYKLKILVDKRFEEHTVHENYRGIDIYYVSDEDFPFIAFYKGMILNSKTLEVIKEQIDFELDI